MNDRVIAVVVSFNRKTLLRDCMDSLLEQTYAPAEIIVVDNASTDGTREMLDSDYDDKVSRIYMTHNVGGSGGFYRGMKAAYDNGADWMWLMDDDGLPRKDALAQMMQVEHRNKYGMLNSLIVNPEKIGEVTFGIDFDGRAVFPIKEVIELQKGAPVIVGKDGTFNGTLVSRKTVETVGFTKREMFIWGDERNFADRVREAGIEFGTVVDSHHLHPCKPWNNDQFWFFGTLALAPAKLAHVHARNMGFQAATQHRTIRATAKSVGYPLYFLKKGDFKRAWTFVRYWIDGFFDIYRLPPTRTSLLAMSEQFDYIPVRKVAHS
jgi:rhamnopyranosyl-N-acetylglucosaminyl-diphospho-decaprenol beta-1,3/1,4-galactofuranosyltransferase